MTSYSVVFKKSESCNLSAVKIWQEKYGILKPAFLFTLCFLINIFAALLSFFSMYFEKDFDEIGTFLFVILQTLVFTFMIVRTIKGKIIPEMAKNMDLKIKECSDRTQITLREEDFEIKTQYKKTNYFYSEAERCFDNGTYCMIVVDKYAYPVVISYISLVEGEKEAFSALLKEKFGDKYERGV